MSNEGFAVGVFDSGVGGLTVLKRLMTRMPALSTVYLGDTARVPYGTKSADTVVRYAAACARLLMERGIRLLVVACNTASAYALDHLRDSLDIPVIGVVEPGARAAVAATRSGRIGVIGTAGTISSGAYQRAIHAIQPEIQIQSQPCPLFVPLAEEGWVDGDVPRAVAHTYLGALKRVDVDTVVLGCTHYPLLKSVIGEVMGDGVVLIDSAEAVSSAVHDSLEVEALGTSTPTHRFLVTDRPEPFRQIGERFLGLEIDDVEWVDVA